MFVPGTAAGETVLIHAGAGGVGLAAISICRHLGAATVYTTASVGKQVVSARELASPTAPATPALNDGGRCCFVLLPLLKAFLRETLGVEHVYDR